jgi:hypothetical protein
MWIEEPRTAQMKERNDRNIDIDPLHLPNSDLSDDG